MKLYWRYKKDGKWTWKPVSRPTLEELNSGKYPVNQGYFTTDSPPSLICLEEEE